jgi:hypothetical protein
MTCSKKSLPPVRLSFALLLGIAGVCVLLASCGKSPTNEGQNPDPRLGSLGSIEVTAKLTEIPEGAIFKRDLYDYATILRYEVQQVHRGNLTNRIIFVAHYDPWKPRREATDQRVKTIGGNLRQFKGGDVHRMALEVPLDDYFMGGIINKYFGQETGPLYWAVWTDSTSH